MTTTKSKSPLPAPRRAGIETGREQSPVFAATFEDGTQTRLTTYCEPGALDPARGIRLANAAWQSRHRTARNPPPIAEACFETASGELLKSYTPNELKEVTA